VLLVGWFPTIETPGGSAREILEVVSNDPVHPRWQRADSGKLGTAVDAFTARSGQQFTVDSDSRELSDLSSTMAHGELVHMVFMLNRRARVVCIRILRLYEASQAETKAETAASGTGYGSR
jgi:hypothetical protein